MAAIKRAYIQTGGMPPETIYFSGDMWMVENGGHIEVKWADSEEEIQEFFTPHAKGRDLEEYLQSLRESASEIRIEDVAGSDIYELLSRWGQE